MCLGIKLLHREFSRHLSGDAKPRRARVKKKNNLKNKNVWMLRSDLFGRLIDESILLLWRTLSWYLVVLMLNFVYFLQPVSQIETETALLSVKGILLHHVDV